MFGDVPRKGSQDPPKNGLVGSEPPERLVGLVRKSGLQAKWGTLILQVQRLDASLKYMLYGHKRKADASVILD